MEQQLTRPYGHDAAEAQPPKPAWQFELMERLGNVIERTVEASIAAGKPVPWVELAPVLNEVGCKLCEPVVAQGWLPIESAPRDGRTMLLGYFNVARKWRTLRGQWMSADYIAEYFEDPDTAEPGWFETSVEADDPPNCWPTNPTHFQPLPAAPGAAAPQPPAAQAQTQAGDIECHGLDTPERVCFYEQDFYVLSNFSSFSLEWEGLCFPTSEAAYHWEKFVGEGADGDSATRNSIAHAIYTAPSAHEAFKIAEAQKHLRRQDWDAVKVDIMRNILREKAQQHAYVRRKLLATGDRELVENSWRDSFWGWGPNRDGQNMLGKLWMEIRSELRAAQTQAQGGEQ